MSRHAHLTDALVLELVTSPGAETPAAAAAHLAECAHCAADVREIRELVEHVRDDAAEPPASLVARVWTLLPPPAPKPRMSHLFPLASLVFDSHAALPSASLRAGSALRHLTWHAQGLAVDAQVEPAAPGGGGHLTGQIVPEPPALAPRQPGDIWLEVRGGETYWAPLDSGGEFSLPAPRARHWSLWIDWGGWRVRLRGA